MIFGPRLSTRCDCPIWTSTIHKVVADSQVVAVPTSATETDDIAFSGSATFFIEGAAKIGLIDVSAGKDSPFIAGDIDNGDLPLPMFTAFIAQQGSVPYARVLNNTLVGRGGDLFDGNGVATWELSSKTMPAQQS